MGNPPSSLQASLQDKVVLVTGAAKRIGRGIALRLAREGARVAIHYWTSEAEARATAAECGGAPLYRANLESVAEIERMFGEVERTLGRLDGLVNNAARFTRRDPLEITEADWDFVHSVNLKAVFFCCQNGARLMRKSGGGRIVNISSLGGLRPWADHAHLLRVEGRRDYVDACAGQGFRPGDHGEFCGAGGDSVRRTQRGGHADNQGYACGSRRHAG